VFISVFTLFFQLCVLFTVCLGVGLASRFFIPSDFSLLSRVLFSLIGGLFLVVLIPQNLVYLGLPVRISAWFILAAALGQIWLIRHQFLARLRIFSADADIQTLSVVILLTLSFHGIVPIRQGLEWYYGKGYDDQINYVLLAEFLKEEPYSTSERDIGLRPWLVRPVGFRDSAEQLGISPGPGLQMVGLKNQRIGQSIVTAEISVWSGTDAKAGYAATVIFFLTLIAISLYVFLREAGLDHFVAASGALTGALLPAVTRLSLDGFLSQASILFIFPFFASLLRHQDLSARTFTLFFSVTLAYLVSAYSEMAPIGFCILLLGVIFVRRDKVRAKRLILMGAILLTALLNPYYLRNLVEFLAQQYLYAANGASMAHMAPHLGTVRGWSELIFGAIRHPSLALFFDYFAVLLSLLLLAGALFLTKSDQVIFGVILLPVLLAILHLATGTTSSYYPVAKLTLTVLPFVIGLVFVPLSRAAADQAGRPIAVVKKALSATIVAAAASGSIRYYSEVLSNGGFLKDARAAPFLSVCRQLETVKNKRVLIFETHPWLSPWLYYHARHNEVYFNGRFISDTSLPQLDPFSNFPDLSHVDLVVTRNRIVDLRAPGTSCLTLVVDISGEDWTDGHVRYWLGPPADLRFLALRPISANLRMRLTPGPEATTLPIDYFLSDVQGHVSQGQLWGENVEVRPINLPQGLSKLQLSVKAKGSESATGLSFPVLAELEDLEISEIAGKPGG
jgi:hypothetical protein